MLRVPCRGGRTVSTGSLVRARRLLPPPRRPFPARLPRRCHAGGAAGSRAGACAGRARAAAPTWRGSSVASLCWRVQGARATPCPLVQHPALADSGGRGMFFSARAAVAAQFRGWRYALSYQRKSARLTCSYLICARARSAASRSWCCTAAAGTSIDRAARGAQAPLRRFWRRGGWRECMYVVCCSRKHELCPPSVPSAWTTRRCARAACRWVSLSGRLADALGAKRAKVLN
jgi:hypothetical protein